MSDLDISTTRMLKLMAYAIEHEFARNESDYCDKIGFQRTNINNIKRGHQQFTKEHVANACRLTGANANWILGLENNMMRKETKDPIKRLKEISIELEAMKQRKKL